MNSGFLKRTKRTLDKITVEMYYFPKFQEEEKLAGGEIRARYMIPELQKHSKEKTITLMPSLFLGESMKFKSLFLNKMITIFLLPLYITKNFPSKKYNISFFYCSSCYIWELLPVQLLKMFHSKFKVVCISHDTPKQREGYRFYRSSEKMSVIKSLLFTYIEKFQEFLILFVDLPIAETKFAQDYFKPEEVKSRSVICPAGIPAVFKNSKKLIDRVFDVVYVGRVIPRKNLASLLSALSSIKVKLSILIITNTNKYIVEGLIRRNFNNELVKITARYNATEEEKFKFLLDSKISVNISYDETFSISTLESASCGTALILSDNVFFKNIYGDAAIYVDPFRISEIKGAILELMQDANKLEELGRRALEVARNYTYSNLAEREYSEINKIVAKE